MGSYEVWYGFSVYHLTTVPSVIELPIHRQRFASCMLLHFAYSLPGPKCWSHIAYPAGTHGIVDALRFYDAIIIYFD